MTAKEFAAVMGWLNAITTGTPLAGAKANAYFELLQDLPFPLVLAAAKAVMAESVYPTMPAVGAIRQRAIALQAEADGRQPAIEAFADVMRYVRLGRNCNDPRVKLQPLARRTAECMGWAGLGDCPADRLDVVRAQFERFYNSLREREDRQRSLPAPVRELTTRLFAMPFALAIEEEKACG